MRHNRKKKGIASKVITFCRPQQHAGLIYIHNIQWLATRLAHNQHGLGSKSTCAILLCLCEKHFTALSPAWWSWQAVLNFSHISIKLQADSNILVSPEAGRGSLQFVFIRTQKKQLIIIEDKIEQRLQIGRRQLNDIRFVATKRQVIAYPM